MLDDLRNSSAFIDDEEEQQQEQETTTTRRPSRRSSGAFLGMTASQRFVISLLLFMMVCVFGSFALILTESVVLPFF